MKFLVQLKPKTEFDKQCQGNEYELYYYRLHANSLSDIEIDAAGVAALQVAPEWFQLFSQRYEDGSGLCQRYELIGATSTVEG